MTAKFNASFLNPADVTLVPDGEGFFIQYNDIGEFQRNYSENTTRARSRTVKEMEPAAAGWEDVAPTLMQSLVQPEVLRYEGQCSEAQHRMFERFYKLCRSQTVIFSDVYQDEDLPPDEAGGEEYEVLITNYESTRRGVMRARDGANHTRNYTIEMTVIKRI